MAVVVIKMVVITMELELHFVIRAVGTGGQEGTCPPRFWQIGNKTLMSFPPRFSDIKLILLHALPPPRITDIPTALVIVYFRYISYGIV